MLELESIQNAPQQSNEIISVDSLSKQVSNLNINDDQPLVILDNVSFSILTGETVAIIGPSGSGKSTLLGLMAGLDIPSSGKVKIDGQNIFDLDEDGRAVLRGKNIGFVFQSFQLLPTLTTLENVMLPLELLGIADAGDRALTVLDRVGLSPRLQHYPHQLSGGEQQRVAIARAFAPRPKLLLADEPTGNLDTRTGERIIELLFNLNNELGTTLILVTHDMAMAKRCGRSLQLDTGRLVE